MDNNFGIFLTKGQRESQQEIKNQNENEKKLFFHFFCILHFEFFCFQKFFSQKCYK